MAIPSIKNLITIIVDKFVQGVKNKYPDLNFNSQSLNVFTGWAIAIAPVLRNMYMFNLEANKNATPLEADSVRDNPELGNLESWGQIFLNRQPFEATVGKYRLEITGTNGSIARGTIFNNQNTQEKYTVDEDTIINGKTLVNITSTSVGSIATLELGDILYLTQLIPNVEAEGNITDVLQIPNERETVDDYRFKLLERAPIVPRGGSIGDIVIYGLEVDGVRNIYPYNGNLLGEAVIYIRADQTINVDGIPPQSLIDEVKSKIVQEGNFQAPFIKYLPIIRRKYIVEITGLSNDAQKPNIQNIIKEYFETREPVIDGVTSIDQLNKDLILSSAIFSKVILGIEPDFIVKLTLKVENIVFNGYLRTKNIANVTTLFGSTSPADGAFNIVKDGVSTNTITINGQGFGSIQEYLTFLNEKTLQIGVRTQLIFDGVKEYLRFESDASSLTSQIEIKSPPNGTDLSGANYFDIADAETISEVGGSKTILPLDTERLGQGTIGYLGSVVYL